MVYVAGQSTHPVILSVCIFYMQTQNKPLWFPGLLYIRSVVGGQSMSAVLNRAR